MKHTLTILLMFLCLSMFGQGSTMGAANKNGGDFVIETSMFNLLMYYAL
jgi:hypothetical protein